MLESYLPFIAATIAYPLAGALYHVARTLATGAPPRRPGGWAYTAYLALGALLLLLGSPAFFKAAVDYSYGAPVMWRAISGWGDLRLYLRIARMHEWLNLLAGVALGSLALLPLSRQTYQAALLDLAVYAGNVGWYLALYPIPLKRFYFTYSAKLEMGLPPTLKPYDLVASQLHRALTAGLALGLTLALAARLGARGNTPKQPRHTRRTPILPRAPGLEAWHSSAGCAWQPGSPRDTPAAREAAARKGGGPAARAAQSRARARLVPSGSQPRHPWLSSPSQVYLLLF